MHKLIRTATISSLAALLLAAQNTASIAQSNSPDEIRNAVECVQKQLNGLGYGIGIVTGVVDDKTLAAGKEYVADMKRQDPNWAMEMIAPASARLWCEKVADAHGEVKEFWVAYQRAATNPDANLSVEDLLNRGYQYDVGDGVKSDPAEAAKWYKLAADKGSAAGMRNLAGLYGSGRGVKQDDAEARRLFGMAADKGDAQAQYVLGKWYSAGRGDSLKWFRMAAARGHAEALAELKALGEPLSAPEEPKTETAEALQAAPKTPTQSSWWVGRSPEGQCIAVGEPTSVSPDLTGEHKPKLMVINTFGGDPNMLVVERASGVKNAQTYVNIDGTMFPILPGETGYQFLMLSRSMDTKGEIIWNTKPLMRLAHLAILQSMKTGNWLAVQTVVRDGKDVGKTYTDLYSLDGFASVKADADAQCKNGAAKP